MNEFNYDGHKKTRFYQKTWFRFIIAIIILLIVGGGVFAWKAGSVINKISEGGLLKSVVRSIPGVKNELKGESEGRINVLLLGMRGENIPGGGLLADTIMVVSIKPQEKKVSMISIPRDLYVTVPGTSDKQKINAVHFYGEQKGKGRGLEDMKTIVSEILGIPVHYAASINFKGFEQLIDAVGGIEITLEKPFNEPLQFNESKVCDPNVFTVPTGKYEIKKNDNGKIVAQYPLCTNPQTECGGDFNLPAGKQTLNGNQTLCFVRSRVTSSDFERAKRQQLVLQYLKEKLTSSGTLTDFAKVNNILNALGDNVRSDMQAWEMKRFFEIYSGMTDFQIYQRVLEASGEGLLYHPEITDRTVGYILLPIGDNYDRIHEMANNIFTLPTQSDIRPK